MIKVQILTKKCNAEYYFISLSQRGRLQASHAALLILTSE